VKKRIGKKTGCIVVLFCFFIGLYPCTWKNNPSTQVGNQPPKIKDKDCGSSKCPTSSNYKPPSPPPSGGSGKVDSSHSKHAEPSSSGSGSSGSQGSSSGSQGSSSGSQGSSSGGQGSSSGSQGSSSGGQGSSSGGQGSSSGSQGSSNSKSEAEKRAEEERKKRLEEREKNTTKSQTEKNENEAPEKGDPVLISSGRYVQTENDLVLSFGNGTSFAISRKFQHSNKVNGSLGKGWTTNLDSRLIRGYDLYGKNSADILKNQILKPLQDDTTEGISEFNSIHSISEDESYEEKEEFYKEIIAELEEIKAHFEHYIIQNDLMLEEMYAEEEHYSDDLIISIEAESIEAKKELSAIVDLLEAYELTLSLFIEQAAKIKELQEVEQVITTIYEEEFLPDALYQEEMEVQNASVMFAGTPKHYFGTGPGTLTFINDEGNPVLFKKGKTSNGQTQWKPASSKEAQFYNLVELKDGSYVLSERGGIKKTFSKNGLLLSYEDVNGNAVYFIRGASGFLGKIITTNNESFSVTTRSDGRLVKILNDRDPSSFVQYGYEGDYLSYCFDLDGDRVHFEYEDGYLVKMTKPDSSFVSFTYAEVDSRGEKLTTKTTNEEGFSEQFVYDKKNKLTTYIDHSGKKSLHYFNTAHQEIKEILSDGTTIIYAYDADGNLASENRNGRVTTYAYDARGNKTQTKYADGSTEEWQYNALDKPLLYKDRDGVSLRYSYDEKGNLLSLSRGGKEIFSAVYNEKGLITSSVQASVNYAYSYDTYGNVIQRKPGPMMRKIELLLISIHWVKKQRISIRQNRLQRFCIRMVWKQRFCTITERTW